MSVQHLDCWCFDFMGSAIKLRHGTLLYVTHFFLISSIVCDSVNFVLVNDTVELSFDLRQKSRLLVMLASGQEAALFLSRGIILCGGDLLKSEADVSGQSVVVQVVAAQEAVYNVIAPRKRKLMCAAFHLGNRHEHLQIGDGWLRLEQDYVLKDMLVGLGMHVSEVLAPFGPEAEAYVGRHRHGHDEEATANIRRTKIRPQTRFENG
jgi:urease accessory protein